MIWKVYICGPGKKGPLKIGISNDVKSRFNKIQNNSPLRLYLFKTFNFKSRARVRLVEQWSHYLLKYAHSHGEWFNCALATATKAIFLAIKNNGQKPNWFAATPARSKAIKRRWAEDRDSIMASLRTSNAKPEVRELRSKAALKSWKQYKERVV